MGSMAAIVCTNVKKVYTVSISLFTKMSKLAGNNNTATDICMWNLTKKQVFKLCQALFILLSDGNKFVAALPVGIPSITPSL